jgi:antitoxin component of MazEF toxin-antitoxin module
MSITTRQKIIKIGSSLGSTYPAKALRELGVKAGDEIEITLRTPTKNASNDEVMKAAEAIMKQYKQAFDNLSER